VGISVLGPLRVDGGDPLERRDRVALSVLAVRHGEVVSPEQFADALWGEQLPASWPKQVQILVGRLRKVLGAEAIETTTGGYRLALPSDELDSVRFEQLVERARMLAATGQADRAAATHARALALWQGRPLDELDRWVPGLSEASRLEELKRTAEEDWLDNRLAAGEHRAVAAEAEALATAEPLRERRWAIVALAQYRCGRQGDALRSLHRARRILSEELGIDPGPELVALEAAILRQEPELRAAPEPALASDACPYKGLAPYDVGDEESFFGRDAEVAACLERFRSASLLLVAGPSGCGKSSLVRAGLVPALRRQGRATAVLVPGDDPESAMDAALAGSDDGVVLVIDQLEEVFAHGHAPEVVQAFCRRVAAYAQGRAPVIATLRSDHLGGLSIAPELSRLAERGLHLLRPLAGDELRESVEQPAAQAGLRLEAGLVELVSRDCEGEPGALPLLSHALVETWRRRDGNVLTVEAYRATGGIRGAVARSADRLYDGLDLEQRSVVRSVLLRLVTPSPEGDPVRCRVRSEALLGDPARDRVVSLLVRARLVTSEQDCFELAHEALARAWPRLQSWLDDDAAGQRVLRHLTAAAEGWESLGRPATELYRGGRLDTALEWRDASHPHLTQVEEQFLESSVSLADAETRAATERARRDARQNRRLRGLLATTALLLVAALIAGVVALRQREQARTGRQTATARELAVAADANVAIDAERSVLLALAAVEEADGTLPEVEEALHRALTANRISRRVPGIGGELDWAADGSTFAAEVAAEPGVVAVRDASSGASVRTIQADDVDVTGVAFSADGPLLGTTGASGAARLWDPETGDVVHTLDFPDAGARAPMFSPDGSLFAAAWPTEGGGAVRVLDLMTGRVVHTIEAVPDPVALAFDPTGRRLAIASGEGRVAAVVELASGEELARLEGHIARLRDIGWSPDGTTIATASDDASTRVYDADTGLQRFALFGTTNVTAVDWSPDGTRLLTGSADGTTTVWSVIEGDGRALMTLSAYDTRREIAAVAFSPDGSRVLTGEVGTTSAIVWDVGLNSGVEVANLPAVSFHFGPVEFTADGSRLVAPGPGGAINVWTADTWTMDRSFGGRSTPSAFTLPEVSIGGPDTLDRAAVDPLGTLVAIVRGTGNGTVEVWDLDRGTEVFTVRAGMGNPYPAWSPDGRHLAVAGGDDGHVTVVDRSGASVTGLDAPGTAVDGLAFATDGDLLVAGVEKVGPYDPDEGRVLVWNWRTGELVRTIEAEAYGVFPSPAGDVVAIQPHWRSTRPVVDIVDLDTGATVASLVGHDTEVTDVAYSSDGSRIATAAGGTIRVWDARTGQLQLTLRGHLASVSSLAFGADGSTLASIGTEGIVRIWALDLAELVEIAKHRLTRHLTEEECRRFLHVERCSDASG
jgi:WD40 repeat protein/DNA-binding SARP family transcriptional activator